MPLIIEKCPRCGTKEITFDVLASSIVGKRDVSANLIESFCICRMCKKSTVFQIMPKTYEINQAFGDHAQINKINDSLNRLFNILRPVSIRDNASILPPEYLPAELEERFREGVACLAIECFNAAGTMFRLCLDMATRALLPDSDENPPSSRQRRDLGLRLPWLFESGRLPSDLKALAHCVKEDGNDGAHQGTLAKEDAEDLLDFTVELLKRLYSEPGRIRVAEERRATRRGLPSPGAST